MNQKTYQDRAQMAFELFAKIGTPFSAALTDYILFRSKANTPRCLIQKDPISYIMIQFSGRHWQSFLQELPDVASRVRDVMEAFFDQYKYVELMKNKKLLCDASIAVRRHILFLCNDLGFTDEPYRREYLQLRHICPKLQFNPTPVVLIPASKGMIDLYHDLIEKILTNTPLLGGKKIENSSSQVDEVSEIVNGLGLPVKGSLVGDEIRSKFDEGSVFTIDGKVFYFSAAEKLAHDSIFSGWNAHLSRLDPIANLLICGLDSPQNETIGKLSDNKLLFYILTLLEIFHGVHCWDSPQLSLSLDDMSSLGGINERVLRINLASGYFSSAVDAYEKKMLELPLAPELVPFLVEFKKRNPSAKSVGDYSKGNLRQIHKNELKRYLAQHAPGYDGDAISFQKVFQKVGLLDLNLPASVIGILRGQPLPGSRGESAYLSVSHDELVAACNQIGNQIRINAGLHEKEISYNASFDVFGTTAITSYEYWHRTERFIDEAKSLNELLACSIRVLRGLGLRNSVIHKNPLAYFESLPIPCLVFADKLVAGNFRSRYVPITRNLLYLIRSVAEYCGGNSQIPYFNGNETCLYIDLPGTEKRRLYAILRDKEQFNSGRTAFYNFLLKNNIGEAPRQILVGHGSGVTHATSCQTVVAPKDLLIACACKLFPLYKSEGIDRIAAKLGKKIRKFTEGSRVTPATQISEKSFMKFKTTNTSVVTDNELTSVELYFRSLVFENIERAHIVSGQINTTDEVFKIFKTPSSFAVVLAIQMGIPISNIMTHRAYYCFDSIVRDAVDGAFYFLATGTHEDVGGLFKYPILICENNESKNNILLQLYFKMWDRFKERQLKRGIKHVNTVNSSPIFPTESLSVKTMGSAFKHFLRSKEQRCNLLPDHAFTLLERISTTNSQFIHPGIVVGGLGVGAPIGLNHFSIQDVIRNLRGHVPCLKNIEGNDYTERNDYSTDDLRKNRFLFQHLTSGKIKKFSIPKFYSKAVAEGTDSVEEFLQLFKRYDVVPSQHFFYNVISRASG